jgi:predicted dehydrogenase
MNEKISAGVIGMGKMGILHSGILNSMGTVQLKAVADNQSFVTNAITALVPGISAYSDYRDMIAKENLDVIFIATPTGLHTKIASECISNNIPFFVEKPLGTTVTECKQLVDELKTKPVTNMVGYCKRFSSTFKKGKEIVDSKQLGKLIYFNSSTYISQLFTQASGWRYNKKQSGGGVLNTVSVHAVDLLLWYFRDLDYIQGHTKKHYSEGVEDFAHGYIKFKDGLEGVFDTSWSVRNYRLPEIKIEVHGENGMLIVTDDYVKVFSDTTEKWNTLYKQDLDKGVFFDLGGPEYSLEDDHLITALQNKTKTDVDATDGLRVQQFVEGLYRSAEKKSPVEGAELWK